MKLLLTFILFFSLGTLTFAENLPTSEGRLVSYELKKSLDRKDILAIWKEKKIPKFISPADYGVDIYEIIYMTPWVDGTMIKASGLYFLPKVKDGEKLPIAVYHHGTQLSKMRAPILESPQQGVSLGLAADGFITLMPDYYGIGKGEKMHLYQHAWSEAMSTIYMLYAIDELNKELNIQHLPDIYLTGYSQGGHATLATQKYLQELNNPLYHVVASAPMSGAYDMSGAQSEVMFKPYPQPFYLPYLLVSYQEAYKYWDGNIYDIFKSPYDTIIPKYMDGTKGYSAFNKVLPKVPADMLKPEYVKEFKDDPDFIIRKKISQNDLYDFVPEAPTYLCYCKNDDQVSGKNTEVAYKWMNENGAQEVREKNISNEFDHNQCALFAVVEMKFFFDNVRRGKINKKKGPPLKRMLVNIYKRKKEKEVVEKRKQQHSTENLRVETQK